MTLPLRLISLSISKGLNWHPLSPPFWPFSDSPLLNSELHDRGFHPNTTRENIWSQTKAYCRTTSTPQRYKNNGRIYALLHENKSSSTSAAPSFRLFAKIVPSRYYQKRSLQSTEKRSSAPSINLTSTSNCLWCPSPKKWLRKFACGIILPLSSE